MSQFASALDYVLGELDRRKSAGYGNLRGSTAALARLMDARPTVSAARSPVTPASGEIPILSVAPTGLKADRLAQLRSAGQATPCAKCPYGAEPHNHFVFGVGNPEAELIFVGEAPGADEDREGEPFVGKAGQLLTKIIQTMGLQRSDIYIANVLKCRPDTPGQTSGNRPPTVEEMQSCRTCLFQQVEIIGPKVIVALGSTAMKGLMDNSEPMSSLRGRFHDFKGVPVMATYHPAYLLRNQAPSEKRKVWEDMLLVKERLGHEITERDRNYFLPKG